MWEFALDFVYSLLISVILSGLSFVVLRTRLAEKMNIIEKNIRNIQKGIFCSSLLALLFGAIFFISKYWICLIGFGLSFILFVVSFLSISYLPNEYIKTKIKEISSEGLKEMEKERTDIQWKFDELLGEGYH